MKLCPISQNNIFHMKFLELLYLCFHNSCEIWCSFSQTPKRNFLWCYYASVNSSCAQPPRVGHLQILHCPGAGHLPTPGPFLSFWHARGFLSESNYTEDFTGKKQIGSSVKDKKKIEEGCKGMFSKFLHAFLHCLSRQNYKAKFGAIDVNQRLLVIESNFGWYYLKNILSYL